MRLVGEAFPFDEDSSYVLGMDSHNSINGIRQFALAKGSRVAYIASTSVGGVDEPETKVLASFLLQGRQLIPDPVEHPDGPQSPTAAYSLTMSVRTYWAIQRDK